MMTFDAPVPARRGDGRARVDLSYIDVIRPTWRSRADLTELDFIRSARQLRIQDLLRNVLSATVARIPLTTTPRLETLFGGFWGVRLNLITFLKSPICIDAFGANWIVILLSEPNRSSPTQFPLMVSVLLLPISL